MEMGVDDHRLLQLTPLRALGGSVEPGRLEEILDNEPKTREQLPERIRPCRVRAVVCLPGVHRLHHTWSSCGTGKGRGVAGALTARPLGARGLLDKRGIVVF